MKMITAIVRPEKLEAVKAALFKAEVEGLTITRVSGHGGEKTVLESYRGQPLVYEFHDKIRFDIGVSEPFVDVTIDAIVAAARTGEVGDGKDLRHAGREGRQDPDRRTRPRRRHADPRRTESVVLASEPAFHDRGPFVRTGPSNKP